VSLVVLAAGAAAQAESDLTLPAVPLRAGVTADVHFKVYESAVPSCGGDVVLAVHGITHNAESWRPFAGRMLERGLAGRSVCTVVAIDLPGHGESGLPAGGVRFGALALADYVAVLRASLERLPPALRPDTLLGHSQGGLLIQLAQKALLAGRADLHGLGVLRAVLLTSVPPRPVPWEFADSGAAVPVLSRFIRVNRTLGLHAAIPGAAWPSVFFSDLTGAIVGAPDPADVARYNAPAPLTASLQLIGFLLPRPSVRAGAFAPERGTALTVVALENDSLIRPHEGTLLYEHLTGEPGAGAVIVVAGPTAVHDMHVADPDALLTAIAGATP
jgi:pimeloyl-ACP methyl ester carboxylesterase